ncbi:MAG: N-acetylglucosamine-6-phosphate deacetylase, partial [Clostridiales bacterium]|nr:N-acetylglucosamine-6-phosphate deacetylase [Candidatus Equinaster intestinalis]
MSIKVYKNASLRGVLTDITVENGKIKYIGKTNCDGTDLRGKRLFAGLIDVHAHGCMNIEANSGRIDELSHYEACHGTTSWLPTTATVSLDIIFNAVNRDILSIKGANVLGFHTEGPYISANRKGAQDEKFIRKPDIAEFEKLPNIKMVTVAPEVEGALEFIKNCKAIVALGHTDSDYATAIKAIENGANCLTHTFNAMPPLLHRNPGVIGAAVEKGIYAQLICDGLHVERGAVWALYKALGADRVVLISDSVQTAGLPDGEYTSGGLPVRLKNNECRLLDGTLAGSSAFLLDCVKKAIEFGISEEDAFKMASETPAKLLGVNKG